MEDKELTIRMHVNTDGDINYDVFLSDVVDEGDADDGGIHVVDEDKNEMDNWQDAIRSAVDMAHSMLFPPDDYCTNCSRGIYGARYAVSRRDSDKKLCPECGEGEALEDFAATKKGPSL